MTGLAALAFLAALPLLGGLTSRAQRGGRPPTCVALLRPYLCSAQFSEFLDVNSSLANSAVTTRDAEIGHSYTANRPPKITPSTSTIPPANQFLGSTAS